MILESGEKKTKNKPKKQSKHAPQQNKLKNKQEKTKKTPKNPEETYTQSSYILNHQAYMCAWVTPVTS